MKYWGMTYFTSPSETESAKGGTFTTSEFSNWDVVWINLTCCGANLFLSDLKNKLKEFFLNSV